MSESPSLSSSAERSPGRDAAIAAALFLVASFIAFGDVWRSDPTTSVAVQQIEGPLRHTARADATYQAWLTARNAWTLMSRPHRLFDGPHCAPIEKSVTLGIPMATHGLVGIPAAIVSDEPVLIYNVVLILQTLISAFGMYLLISRWTGVPGAGWVAGLLFGLQPERLAHITHPTVWDISWTVFALYFAERFFAEGRWRDAVGLGTSIALQVGASFYPLMAAACLAPPFLVWLLLRDRLRHVRPGTAAVVLVLAVSAVLFVLAPYLSAESSKGPLSRDDFYYLKLFQLMDPTSISFPGLTVLLLFGVGLATKAQRSTPRIAGDPRWALLLGAAIAFMVATGPGLKACLEHTAGLGAMVPNFHRLLATIVPGLDVIRELSRLVAGVHLVMILIAGLGAGVLIRAAGRHATWAAIALVAVASFDVLRLPAAGIPRRYSWNLEQVRPPDDAIAFFRELDRRGNEGPLLELPMAFHRFLENTQRILLTGYHGRRTSACFGSYRSPVADELEDQVAKLPSTESWRALAARGFSTVVLHRHQKDLGSIQMTAKLALASERGHVVPLFETDRHVAYRIAPPETPPGASAR